MVKAKGLDLCRRQGLVFERAEELAACLEELAGDREVRVVRVKNKLEADLDAWETGGYRLVPPRQPQARPRLRQQGASGGGQVGGSSGPFRFRQAFVFIETNLNLNIWQERQFSAPSSVLNFNDGLHGFARWRQPTLVMLVHDDHRDLARCDGNPGVRAASRLATGRELSRAAPYNASQAESGALSRRSTQCKWQPI